MNTPKFCHPDEVYDEFKATLNTRCQLFSNLLINCPIKKMGIEECQGPRQVQLKKGYACQ
jgi:hypothetical protein